MLQVIASGFALGSIYALVALGFSMTWVTTQTLNFAQGELVMLGALIGVTLYADCSGRCSWSSRSRWSC